MNKMTVLLAVLALAGCGETVTGGDIERFRLLCEPHGGISYVNATNDGLDTGHCRENGIIVKGED